MCMGNTTKSAARKIGLVLGCILILILGFLIWRAFFCPMAEGGSIGGVELSGLSAVRIWSCRRVRWYCPRRKYP